MFGHEVFFKRFVFFIAEGSWYFITLNKEFLTQIILNNIPLQYFYLNSADVLLI
jgi:hypothetical protein